MHRLPDYHNEGVSLYIGDCAEVISESGIEADLIVTSPPYDNIRDYGGTPFDYKSVGRACTDALKDGGVMVWVVNDATIDGSETGTSFRHALFFLDEMGLKLHDTMIYDNGGLGYVNQTNRYIPSFEYMFVFSKGKLKTANILKDRKNKWAGWQSFGVSAARKKSGEFEKKDKRIATIKEFGARFNIWKFSNGKGFTAPDFVEMHNFHPAMFPLRLAVDHIKTWSNEGDVVLDPMCGGGTTLKAAKMLNRKAVGIEIFEDYIDPVIKRVEKPFQREMI